MKNRAAVLALAALVVVSGFAAFAYLGPQGQQGRCVPLGGTSILRSQLSPVTFGAVTEYPLPQPSRWSNGITVGPDGSVWFGEESVPGVARLSPNGTLVEYPWPSAGWTTKGSCGYKTGIWGVKVWNGLVWGTDAEENALVGVDPGSGRATVVNTTGRAPQPYSLAASSDGALWFTTESLTAKLGRLTPDLNLTVFDVQGLGGEVPIQVAFVNSTYAYMVALNPLDPPYGHLYAFDPQAAGGSIEPVRLGGSFRVVEPTSVSASGGLVWMTQHGTSSITSFDPASGNWTVFPTTTVGFVSTTLPYFVEAGGDLVWFNEHYANRIALLNTSTFTLTEFSEANPPVENGSLIQNDLTIARGGGGLWFTSTTGNYVGFVDESYTNPFSLVPVGERSVTLDARGYVTLHLQVEGTWASQLSVGVSDTENSNSTPSLIEIIASTSTIPAGSGPAELTVNVTAKAGVAPGRYTVAVGVGDGLVTQSAYFFLTVP